MIKFLFKNFRNAPGIGNPIKIAYVGHLVKNLVKKTEQDESKSELKNLAANELENAVRSAANELYHESIGSVVSEFGIPHALVAPAKNKAINKLTGILKEQAMKKVNEKI